MSPRKIVRRACERELRMIAITDHNSAENVGAVMAAARGTALRVIPGLEITSAEEAHVLALFAELAAALSMQELVYEHLLPGENDEELFGLQVVANEHDEVEDLNKRLLIGATTLGLDALVNAIHERDGLAVAAHIDRESFSVVGQLGFIPPDVPFDGLGISRRLSLTAARARFPEYGGYAFLTASDAHELEDIGAAPTRVLVEDLTLHELQLALQGREGRRVVEAPESEGHD
jgi:PHP family Zn ribbon phosphoesterase